MGQADREILATTMEVGVEVTTNITTPIQETRCERQLGIGYDAGHQQ